MNEQRAAVAPELDVVAWLNTPNPLTLAELRGKVVVIHAFQMLCPGCVVHGVPQASAIYELYRQQDVQVIGLHTVFEHHAVMNQEALAAFVHEYRIEFPVAIDRPSESGAIPHTMSRFQMSGTPTLIILDKHGHIKLNHFGRMSDLAVGNIIGGLSQQQVSSGVFRDSPEPGSSQLAKSCGDDGCAC